MKVRLDFITSTEAQEDTITTWYAGNLSTHALIPSVHFQIPLNNITLHSTTNLPIKLVSYPNSRTFNVNLSCTNELRIQQIDSNVENQFIAVDFDVTGQACTLIGDVMNDLEFYNTLNSISLTGSATTPTSITFDSDSIEPSYSLGSTVPIRLTSTPDLGNFMVKLTCGNLEPAVRLITSNAEISQDFLIPSHFNGNCVFSVPYPIQTSFSPSIFVGEIRTLLQFVQAPKSLLNVQQFTVKISGISSPVQIRRTVNLQLNCDFLGLVETWTAPLDSTVPLSLNKPDLIGGPYRCSLSTPSRLNFNQIRTKLNLLTHITTDEKSTFVRVNGLTPAAGWIEQI